MDVFGKIVLNMTDTNANKVSETLGYTTSNITTDTTAAQALRTFARGVSGLTTNTYDSSKITYEIDLDSAVNSD